MEIENLPTILMKFYKNVNLELRESSRLTYPLTLAATNNTSKGTRVTKVNNRLS